MSYRPNYLATKRLPAYTGFLVMLIAIGVTVVLSSNSVTFVSKATVGAEPKNIQVSNVSGDSFTISYTTDAPTLGSLGYGSDASSASVGLDDRDAQAGKPVEHQVHYFTVKNLTPGTTYYYVIRSGDQQVTDSGKPFQISTPASSSATTTPATTVSGTVATSDGGIPTEGIVTLSTDGSQQLAALVNPDGTYKIPLTSLLNNTFTTSVPIQPTSILQLSVTNATSQSNAKVLASKADQVPKIVLSQNYDFTLSPDPIASDSAGAAMPLIQTPAPVSSPEITSPTDAQTYQTQQPTFSGRALPSAAVEITIQSQQEITAQIQSDSTGSWQFKPPMQLEPGKHTITIKSPDISGILQTISRSFTVHAAGSQFVEPSVSPIQVSPTIASASPTLAPTLVPSPTATATPTLQPTVTVPPAREPVTPTGSSAIITGFIGGAVAIGIGALFFIFGAL